MPAADDRADTQSASDLGRPVRRKRFQKLDLSGLLHGDDPAVHQGQRVARLGRDARALGGLLAFDCATSDGTPDLDLTKRFARAAFRERLLLFTGGPQDSTVKVVPPLLMDDYDLEFLCGALRRAAARVQAGE